MADAANRAQRAAVLEEKRRKLEELKQSRKRREEDTAKVKATSGSNSGSSNSATAGGGSNLEDYIDGLLKTAPVGSVAASSQQQQPQQQQNGADMISRTSSVDDDTTTATGKESHPPPPSDDGSTLTGGGGAAAAAPVPRTVETFTISTQTEDDDFPEQVSPDDQEEDDEEEGEDADGEAGKTTKDGSSKKKKTSADASNVVKADDDNDNHDTNHDDVEPKILSAHEIEKEIAAEQPSFSSFITTASKKVERMLGAELLVGDLLVDYIGADADGPNRRRDNKDSDEARFISSRQVFECPKWTATRDVTDLDWSLLHRELILSTHHRPRSASSNQTNTATSSGSTNTNTTLMSGSAAVSAISPKDTSSSSLTPRSGELQSDGLALVWSLTMPSRPEHVFTCGSPVTAGRFHPTEPTLILGGCDSGQLVVWDVRAGRLPVQKSAFITVTGASSKGHVHPIGTMEMIEGGLGMVTSSTDGRVNFWSLASLREPVESIQVGDSVSCFAVAPESESLILGDENGALFAVSSSSQSTGQRSSRKHARKLDSTNAEGENFGHYGMITSVSTKTLKKGSLSSANAQSAGLSKGFLRGVGGLVLSSGVDWTVKLWHPVYSESPLLSMVSHSYDYMSHVQWSPSHPSLFATASTNGTVGLWNLATSMEEPLTGQEGLVIEPDAMSGRGLNKLKWSTDGRRMAVASADRVHVLGFTEDVIRPKGDEESKVMNQLMTRGLISRQ